MSENPMNSVPAPVVPLDTLVASIKDAVKNGDSAVHAEVISTLSDLLISLEKPIDVLRRMHDAQMPLAVVKSAIDAGIFNALAEGGQQALATEDIASKTGAAPLLTGRILRYLAAQGLVVQVGSDEYTANEKTEAFAHPAFQGAVNYSFGTGTVINEAIPSFLKEHEYQDIMSNTDTPFTKAFNTSLPYFAWLQQNPEQHKYFNQWMSIQRLGLVTWLSSFPVESEIGNWKPNSANTKSSAAVFVDVGGGLGFQAIAFNQKYPSLGRVVLQDLPSVIEQAEVPASVEKQPNNFFEGQAEKGAKFYYLRNILHDYNDDLAISILRHLLAALGPDSEILIDEMCIPAKGATLFQTTRDVRMGFLLGAVERTVEQWEQLLDAAGLRIKARHQYTRVLADTVIVAVPK